MKNHLRLYPSFLVVASALVLAAPCFAQPAEPAAGSGNDERRGGRRFGGNFDIEEIRKRMSAEMKEQFKVENDEEWALIYERITKIAELRRANGMGAGAAMGGFMAMRGRGPGGGEGEGGGGGRRGGFGMPGAVSSPESEALATAIKNNASPEEIKARIDRLREARKTNDAKIVQAQEDLRAVLNVRQEGVAVLLGLLP